MDDSGSRCGDSGRGTNSALGSRSERESAAPDDPRQPMKPTASTTACSAIGIGLVPCAAVAWYPRAQRGVVHATSDRANCCSPAATSRAAMTRPARSPDVPGSASVSPGEAATQPDDAGRPAGMVRIPGGEFLMGRSVREWRSDLYHERTYSLRLAELGDAAVALRPAGVNRSHDTRNRFEPVLRVLRGGSFLRNDSHCASCKPSARMASAPGTGLSHPGFMRVADAPSARPQPAVPSGLKEVSP